MMLGGGRHPGFARYERRPRQTDLRETNLVVNLQQVASSTPFFVSNGVGVGTV
jgi:hypothetical protein